MRLCGVYVANHSLLLPVLATPVPSRLLTRWVAVTLMPCPKATPAVWIALLNGHLGIAVADCLALTALAGSDYELLRPTRGTPRAVTG